jgi:hypothetical protein
MVSSDAAQLAANLGKKWPKRIGFLWISIENPRWFTISSSGTAGKHGTKWKTNDEQLPFTCQVKHNAI